jgi:hypothetical protein
MDSIGLFLFILVVNVLPIRWDLVYEKIKKTVLLLGSV